MPNTILLKGGGVRTEEKAGGTITPGMQCFYDGSGDVVANGTAAKFRGKMFALEHEVDGNGIDADYSDNDNVFLLHPQPGSVIYGFITQAAVKKGDLLAPSDGGAFVKATDAIRDVGAVTAVAGETLAAVTTGDRRCKLIIV